MSDSGVRADPPGNAIDAEAAVMDELDLVPDVRMTPAERYQFARNVVAVVRQRIYASDNFPGDGSVGPDEIPAEYRHLDAAYWHRRWLWTMNRLDEAPTAWDVDAARRGERQRIMALAEQHDAHMDCWRPSFCPPECEPHALMTFADLLRSAETNTTGSE